MTGEQGQQVSYWEKSDLFASLGKQMPIPESDTSVNLTLKDFQEESWTSPLLLPLRFVTYQIEELWNLLHHYGLLYIGDHQ